MHKIFAKPTFLGKKVVFLPQCHSTNDELSALSRLEKIPEGTVIYTDHQLSGKGQRGSSWEDESGKNILLSLLLRPKKLPVKFQFFLNLVIGLAVLDTLKESLRGKNLSLKWPNDVYVGSKKISGILIENSLKGSAIDSSIVGIGLNANQNTHLPPNAISLLELINKPIDRLEFIDDLLVSVEIWYLKLMRTEYDEILTAYHEHLLWKDQIHMFQDDVSLFTGKIRGIDSHGKLIIDTSYGERTFDVKEVKFIN